MSPENVAPDWGANGWIAYTSRQGRYVVCVLDPETKQTKLKSARSSAVMRTPVGPRMAVILSAVVPGATALPSTSLTLWGMHLFRCSKPRRLVFSACSPK